MPLDAMEMTNGAATSSLTSSDEPSSSGRKLHAHWDCFSGAAGDMMLAACLDAAGDMAKDLLHRIESAIQQGLPEMANEFQIDYQRVWRGSGSIAALHVTVRSIYDHAPVPVPSRTQEEIHPSNHNHEHSHEHDHAHLHEHHSPHAFTVNNVDEATEPAHHHSHAHGTDEVMHPSNVRNLPQIRQMLLDASENHIPPWVRDTAIEAFTELAQAEATVHGASSIEDVHFHEVGAIDSIVDTVGTLLALYFLGVTSVSCSRLPLGEGTVRTAHGILPVPAPATLQLLLGMPTTPGPPGWTGELVTPTAASLMRVLVTHPGDGRPPSMTLRQVGVGAGSKDFARHPNIVRLMLGECSDAPTAPSLKTPSS
jgi:pyridinium-3,5-bisthiocarboxylic acid mononucleotide nickel chelatase